MRNTDGCIAEQNIQWYFLWRNHLFISFKGNWHQILALKNNTQFGDEAEKNRKYQKTDIAEHIIVIR